MHLLNNFFNLIHLENNNCLWLLNKVKLEIEKDFINNIFSK